MIMLVTMYFVCSQILNTGFFTSSFGPVEMILFYIPIPLGIGVQLVRLTTGHRNPARPLEAIDAFATAVACFWLYAVFPFNFGHFADLVPGPLQFLLSWIPNYLAKFVLLIGGVGSLANGLYQPMVYTAVRSEYSRASAAGHRVPAGSNTS